MPENQRSRCGPGRVDQSVECRDVWRRPVDEDLCRRHNADLLRRVYQCYKPCDGADCAVSEWGTWSPCPTGCGNNKKRTQSR